MITLKHSCYLTHVTLTSQYSVSRHSHPSLPLSSPELSLSLFPPSPRLGKMESRCPSLDGPVAHAASNHNHKHECGWNGDDPEVNV